jgi:hypothetical protein
MRITSSGSVGIGTTAPDTPLHVQSTSATTANIMANGDYGLIVNCAGNGTDGEGTGIYLSGLRSDTNVTRGVALIAERNTSGNAHDFIIGTNAGASTPTEKMRITSAGDVGIGTTSPDSKLHVVGNTHIYNAANLGMDAAGAGQLKVTGGATSQYSFAVSVDDAGTYLYNNGGSRNIIIGLNEVERFKLSSAGALTINQAYTLPNADGSANQVLQTDGAGNVSFATVSGGSTTINNNADNRVITGDGTANTLNGESNFTFDGTDMVIGEATSDYSTTIYSNGGSSPNLVLRSQSGGTRAPSLEFNIAGVSLYQIVANNNVSGVAANTLTVNMMGTPKFYFYSTGDFTITGDISKAGGSFKIDHPLESKKDTHHLVHSFIEGPKADLIYRGKVDLVDGTAQINIDTVSNMTEGTFVALNTDVQCFTTNESNWDLVKGSVSGNILTIECQNTNSTATISWMVIGERQDPHMMTTKMTDDEGKIIVEPEKENV